jgi:hypothetical protein
MSASCSNRLRRPGCSVSDRIKPVMGEVRQSKTGSHSRRRKPKGWRAIPKPVFVVVALSLALLILIPLSRKKPASAPSTAPGSNAKPSTSLSSTAIPPSSAGWYTGDLELSEAAVDPVTRKIKGRAKNISAKVYENVQVSFSTVDNKGLRGSASALVGRLEPHTSAAFETQPLPVNWRGYSLPEITGTAR